MKRNAFIVNQNGQIYSYDPSFTAGEHETDSFIDGMTDVTANGGVAVCLSALVSVDALLNLLQIIKGELEARTSKSNVNVDLPDTAAQDSASKSNNPAVSG